MKGSYKSEKRMNKNTKILVTLPETNMAPENGWLESNTSFLLGWPIFRGYVSFREGICFKLWVFLQLFRYSSGPTKVGGVHFDSNSNEIWSIKMYI